MVTDLERAGIRAAFQARPKKYGRITALSRLFQRPRQTIYRALSECHLSCGRGGCKCKRYIDAYAKISLTANQGETKT